MKKNLVLSVIAAIFGFISCTNDEDMAVKSETTVTFSIQTEPLLSTRAAAPTVTGKDARYIVEVWNADSTARLQRIVQINQTSFSLVLDRALSYTVAVWVDYVNTGTETDYYYVTTNFKDIELNTIDEDPGAFEERRYLMSNLPARDAFTGVFPFIDGQPYPTNLLVKRPLAKINIIATDAGLWQSSSTINGDTIKLSITNPAYYTYNVLLQHPVATSTKLTFVNNIAANVYANYPVGVNQIVLSGLYFANTASANNSASTPNFVIHTQIGSNPERPVIPITGLPFKRNFITNITGGLIFNSANFDIDTNSQYDDPDINETIP